MSLLTARKLRALLSVPLEGGGEMLPGRRRDATSAPTAPGIYFLINRRKIVYVGKSKNPLCRIGQHARRLALYPFDSFAVLPCPLNALTTAEGIYINKLLPPYNKNGR